ncbi:MAG: Hsp20/alpha crystallin family protein [Deltaproteobacteria bacterium]|nr:Hsp20/alpha crystallin family protein [Deltaproteobacteria bacterium]
MLFSDVRKFNSMFDPWHDLDHLHREMNRLFSGRSLPFSREYPAINIWGGDEDVIVTSEIPGINPENIDISVEGDVLTISGSRTMQDLKKGEKYHRQEREHGTFKRKVRLSFRIDPNRVAARYERGVLSITLPGLEADKPKKISIKTE